MSGPAPIARRVVIALILWMIIVGSFISWSMVTAAHSQGTPPTWAQPHTSRR